MLDREKHKFVMIQILKNIYSDISIASLLGFKGGTAAYFFFGLPRFSVDLDFDLLEDTEENREFVFKKVRKILEKLGRIKDEQIKFSTIFFALSYGEYNRQVKVEINLRKTLANYQLQNYFGIPLLVSTKESMFSAKLIALTGRKKFAARDLFDVYFFLKENWETDPNVFKAFGISSEREYMKKVVEFVENIPSSGLLKELGELIDEKQKDFVREKIRKEIIFLIRSRWEI